MSSEPQPVSDLPQSKPIPFRMSRSENGWWIERTDLNLQAGPFSFIPDSFGNNDAIEKMCAELQLTDFKDQAAFRRFLLGVNVNLKPPFFENDLRKNEINDLQIIYEKFFNEAKQFIPKKLGDHVLSIETLLTNLHSREIYVYREGFYQAIGEQVIEQYCKKFLGDEYKNHRAIEVIGYIKASTYTEPKEPSINLVNLDNGVLDVDAMILIPHDPKFQFFQKIPVKYDPAAKCPLIEKFLTEISSSPEDKAILIEWVGYNLLRSYPIQKALMLIGEGANGKSTYLNLVKTLLGSENVASKSLQDLENHRFAKASLFGKLANISPDLPDVALKRTGTFKALTGGDAIDGEKKFKDSFPFWNYAKLSFSCNKMPQVDDNTDAFFRRWLIAVFPNKFENGSCDQNILEKLCTPEELSGLLNLALEALKKILNQRAFSYSRTTDQVRADYIAKSDPIGGFVLENIENDTEAEIIKKELFDLFAAYCREKNLPVVNSDTFFKNLPKYVQYTSVKLNRKGERCHAFRGIRFTKEGEELRNRSTQSTQSTLNISLSNYQNVQENNIRETVDSLDSLDLNHGKKAFFDPSQVIAVQPLGEPKNGVCSFCGQGSLDMVTYPKILLTYEVSTFTDKFTVCEDCGQKIKKERRKKDDA